MLDVKSVQYLDYEIRKAHERYLHKRLVDYCNGFIRKIRDDETIMNKFIADMLDSVKDWYYPSSSACYIHVGYTRFDPNDYVPLEMRNERDNDIGEIEEGLIIVQDRLLDILYSRPSDEEIELIHDYINKSRSEIECAK